MSEDEGLLDGCIKTYINKLILSVIFPCVAIVIVISCIVTFFEIANEI